MAERVSRPRTVVRVTNWLASDAADGIPPKLTIALVVFAMLIEGEGLERSELSLCRDDDGTPYGVMARWAIVPRELRVTITDRVRPPGARHYHPEIAWACLQRVGHCWQLADERAFSGPGWIDPVRRAIDWVHGGSAIASQGGIEGVESRGW